MDLKFIELFIRSISPPRYCILANKNKQDYNILLLVHFVVHTSGMMLVLILILVQILILMNIFFVTR